MPKYLNNTGTQYLVNKIESLIPTETPWQNSGYWKYKVVDNYAYGMYYNNNATCDIKTIVSSTQPTFYTGQVNISAPNALNGLEPDFFIAMFCTGETSASQAWNYWNVNGFSVGLFRISGAVTVGGAITCYVEGVVPD